MVQTSGWYCSIAVDTKHPALASQPGFVRSSGIFMLGPGTWDSHPGVRTGPLFKKNTGFGEKKKVALSRSLSIQKNDYD